MQLMIFDLDGTLADTRTNIASAINYTLLAIGMEPLSREQIVSYVGHGSKSLLQRCFDYYGCEDKDLYERAISIFYPYYYDNVCSDTDLYPGVRETLGQLPQLKAVLTNKPEKMAIRLINHLKLNDYFTEIVGANAVEHLKPNPYHLNRFIDKYKIELINIAMIGDSPVDIQVAKNAGVVPIGVSYGFHSKEDLKADIIIDHFSQLLEYTVRNDFY